MRAPNRQQFPFFHRNGLNNPCAARKLQPAAGSHLVSSSAPCMKVQEVPCSPPASLNLLGRMHFCGRILSLSLPPHPIPILCIPALQLFGAECSTMGPELFHLCSPTQKKSQPQFPPCHISSSSGHLWLSMSWPESDVAPLAKPLAAGHCALPLFVSFCL